MTIHQAKAIKKLLLTQYRRYPASALQDMVKVLFQNEFGPGHLISDETASLNRIQAELRENAADQPALNCKDASQAAQNEDEADSSLFEDIGNGLCRLHLSRLSETTLSAQTANRLFLQTAEETRGSMERFTDKLSILQACCAEGSLPFSPEEAEPFLQSYQNAGCPPPGHSTAYRSAYRPAYRIVKEEFKTYLPLFCRIDAMLGQRETITAAIDGPSGAGKSALSALISGIYDSSLFHMDHFFLPPERKTKERLLEPGENVDYERFYREVAKNLKESRPFRYHIYDCAQNTFLLSDAVQLKKFRLMEGVYSMHPSLSGLYDLKIFLRIDPEEQKRRILQRNGERMLERFISEWIPLENLYFEKLRIEAGCDLVFGTTQPSSRTADETDLKADG